MNGIWETICLLFLFICLTFVPPSATQEWNCTLELGLARGLCVFRSNERRTFQEASTHCFQRNGGLPHGNDTEFLKAVSWPPGGLVWKGLAWVNGRLQWMTHTPQEETFTAMIADIANRERDAASCFSVDRGGVQSREECHQQFYYFCVKPASREDILLNNTILIGDVKPNLTATGNVKVHSPFYVVDPNFGVDFQLYCKADDILLSNCSHTRIRWLRNGAYQPQVDNSLFIGNNGSILRDDKISWLSNWLGKVTCELFCFSTGKAYQSQEAIIVLADTVALRIEFQFRSVPVANTDILFLMRQHFDQEITPVLKQKMGNGSSIFHTDPIPFLPNPLSINIFTFYSYVKFMNPDQVLPLAIYLQTALDEPNHWFTSPLDRNRTALFQNIKVILLNFCVENGTKSTNRGVVFATQPTISRGLNSRHRHDDTNTSTCQYASQQCKADGYNPPKWEPRPQSLSCLRCLANFTDHNERCLAIIRPQPFAKSIAQCLAKYDSDQNDNLWNLTDWIEYSIDWLNVKKQSGATLNFNQIWIPVKRRTNLGPLRPVWPWNFKETNQLEESSWGEQLKIIVNQTGLRADWSHLNASESCLTLDISTQTLKSASCQAVFPMICVRPKLSLSVPYGVSEMFRTSAQCPFGWRTSELIAERNYCYNVFYNEVGVTFDEAEEECRKYDGHLAVLADPSTLAVFIHMFNSEELIRDFWIGLKKVGGKYEWSDKSSWTYEHQIEWTEPETLGPDDFNESYGVTIQTWFSFEEKIRKVEWKRKGKESRLPTFACQKKIFPQRQNALQLKVLNINYAPEISIHPLPLHLKHVFDRDRISSDTPLNLELDAEVFPDSRLDERITHSNLICFMANSTFTFIIRSNRSTLNYEMIKQNHLGHLSWRAAETSCETWDNWSTESLQVSWVMPGDVNQVDLTSYIIWLRHRTQIYSTEEHDATFQNSDGKRAEFDRTILIANEFVKRSSHYFNNMIRGNDSISFQAEPHSRNSLLIKYQMVIRQRGILGTPATTVYSVRTRFYETEFPDLHNVVTSMLNSGNNTSHLIDFDLVSIRSTDYCPGELTDKFGKFVNFSYVTLKRPLNSETELEWPQSYAGSWVEPSPQCVTPYGFLLRRRCLGDRYNGLYWESLENKGGVDQPLCIKTSPLFQKLQETIKMDNTSQILETIRFSIERWDPNAAELELLAMSLSRSVQYSKSKELNNKDLDHLQMIIQHIMDLKTDKLIFAQQSSFVSSNLAGATEQLFAKITTLDIGKLFENSTQRLELTRPFIAARSFDRPDGDDSFIGFSVSTNENSIIRSDLLSSQATYEEIQESNVVVLLPTYESTERKQRVTFVAYPDTRLIDASAASGKFSSAVFSSDPSQSDGLIKSDKLYTGSGGMVQVRISPLPSKITKPITVLFRSTTNVTGNRHLLRCAYWDERVNSGRGGWSIDGCWLDSSPRKEMEVCRCNHISTFTLLVCQSENYLQSTVHGAILNVITIMGSIASMFGLSLILATFAMFPTWRKSRGHKLLVQLSAALILLLITFIGGVNNISNSHACRAAGVFLHYFLLATFCWMTVEAYHQYLRMVKVFDTYISRFLMKASIFAWALPLIPVLSVLIYDVDSYTTNQSYCWLENTPFYVAVLFPIICLMLINIGLFYLVTKSILASGRGLRTNQSEEKQNREKLIACFLNVVLLGLSWIFGFLAIGPTNSVIFSYLFCISTTFQGYFLFILYVVRDPSARQLWFKLFGVDVGNRPVTKSPAKKSQAQSSADQHLPSSEVITSNA